MRLIKPVKSEYSRFRKIRISSPFTSRALLVLLILLIISLFVNIKLIVFLTITIFLNATMENFRLKRGLPTDFELSTLSTVLVTIVFGLKWGIMTAIFSKLITSIATGNVLADHLFMIATYINAALIASLFPTVNVFWLGMVIIMINCILMFFISKNILGVLITENLSYTITNFTFNFIVFSIFSQLVLNLLRM